MPCVRQRWCWLHFFSRPQKFLPASVSIYIIFDSTAYNLWTFTWFVHFELPFRLKGTDKTHTEGLSKFHSNIYSILFDFNTLWFDLEVIQRLWSDLIYALKIICSHRHVHFIIITSLFLRCNRLNDL